MRSIRLSNVCGGCVVPLMAVALHSTACATVTAHRFSSVSALKCFHVASPHATRSGSSITYSSRWYATAHTNNNNANENIKTNASTTTTAATTTFARLSTAAEAAAELQRWLDAVDPAKRASPSPPLHLSGKSIVLCVAALQLRDAALADAPNSTSAMHSGEAAGTPAVQLYLKALAHHIYTACNASGKPRAAWAIMEDVENSTLRAEALHTSLHYLQHHAFASETASSGAHPEDKTTEKNGEREKKPRKMFKSVEECDERCAARDLELTLEAVEVLLAGRQISEIHRAAAACGEVGSPSTTASMVPPAEAAAFYIGRVVHLTHTPFMKSEDEAAASAGHHHSATASSPFVLLPSAKQQFWTQSAQQLTTVLYLALLVTNVNTTDAQIVSNAFKDALRKVYGVSAERFGVGRGLHYMCTVVLPYVSRSLSTIVGVVRAQQEEAAKEATAAAKARLPPQSPSALKGAGAQAQLSAASQKVSSFATATKSTTAAGGRSYRTTNAGSNKNNETGGGGGAGMASDRMNKITLIVVCVAAALYVASSTGPAAAFFADDDDAAKKAAQADAEGRQQTLKKLSAMATSQAVAETRDKDNPPALVNALQSKINAIEK